MEDAVNVSTAGDSGRIVIAGAGYAGLQVALRLTERLRNNPTVFPSKTAFPGPCGARAMSKN
jgi:hypothetical protein